MDSDSDAEREHVLRNVVRAVFRSGKHEELTVKRVRRSVEWELGLPDGFFKRHTLWKERSKDIITDEVAVQEQREGEPVQEAPSSLEKPNGPQKRGQAAKSGSAVQKRKASEVTRKPSKKQAANPKAEARKRRKVSVSSDEEPDAAVRSDASSAPEVAPKKAISRKPTVIEEDSDRPDEESPAANASASLENSSRPGPAIESDGGGDVQAKAPSPAKEDGAKAADSDSELSVLVDEAPAPKKKRQKKAASGKEKATKSAGSKNKEEKDLDPQEAEIKRLQGWLVKCGIRKLWGKELKPLDSPRAKISHLKAMLKEAGMDGRYSVEKARQIKERRELAADLEAVQEGAKRWGQSGSDDDDDDDGDGVGRPKRRLAKGLKDLEGLVESDGEESG